MAIKVNFTVMNDQIKAASDSYDELEKQLEAADAARNAAVLAAGGQSTEVGKAINKVLGDVMANRLSEAKTLIVTLASQISRYKNTYTEANQDLVNFINMLEAKNQESGVNNGGVGGNDAATMMMQ